MHYIVQQKEVTVTDLSSCVQHVKTNVAVAAGCSRGRCTCLCFWVVWLFEYTDWAEHSVRPPPTPDWPHTSPQQPEDHQDTLECCQPPAAGTGSGEKEPEKESNQIKLVKEPIVPVWSEFGRNFLRPNCPNTSALFDYCSLSSFPPSKSDFSSTYSSFCSFTQVFLSNDQGTAEPQNSQPTWPSGRWRYVCT